MQKKYMKTWETKQKGYCLNTAIATNCTVHLDTKVTVSLHSLRWQWLVIIRLYSYLLALEFGAVTKFGIEDHHVKPWGCLFQCYDRTVPCNADSPTSTACKQIALERQTLALRGKNTNSKSTEANKETEKNGKKKNCCTKRPRKTEKSKCRALTESSYQHQCQTRKYTGKIRIGINYMIQHLAMFLALKIWIEAVKYFFFHYTHTLCIFNQYVSKYLKAILWKYIKIFFSINIFLPRFS